MMSLVILHMYPRKLSSQPIANEAVNLKPIRRLSVRNGPTRVSLPIAYF